MSNYNPNTIVSIKVYASGVCIYTGSSKEQNLEIDAHGVFKFYDEDTRRDVEFYGCQVAVLYP